ncbi:Probable protein phosphatase 2C 38 [Linum grandiflorum]
MGKPCWRACMVEDDTVGKVDGLMWHKDLGCHAYGDFSMAVIQANAVLEDYSQLESGPLSSSVSSATFVGVYDGHGGPQASKFASNNLFFNLKNLVSEQGGVTETTLKKVFSATEEDFLSMVRKRWMRTPQIASAGSCCLAGVLCDGMLYVANAGDSRAVLGRMDTESQRTWAVQLCNEHNVNIESVREELRSLHPDDSEVVVLKHKCWRVRGLIQVSRSIGDAYLKKAEFQRDPLLPKFRLTETFEKPILNSEPEVTVHRLQPEDQFVIFASDGLWEHLSSQEAVDIVHRFPRNGIAKRLMKAALHEAAKKREMRYTDLQKIDPGVRRHFHDDITVIVVFIDHDLVSRSPLSSCPLYSIKGGASRH